MPVASAITLADSIPANHVFSPVQVATGKALLLNRASTIPATNEQLLLEMDLASSKRVTDRIKVALYFPVEKTVDGVVQVRSTARFISEFIVPADFLDLERYNFLTLVKNLMASSIVSSYVRTRDPMYG